MKNRENIPGANCPENKRRFGIAGKRLANPGLLFVMALLFILGGCKTTVKNYQDAYEVAVAKREQDEARRRELQQDLGINVETLQEVDGARRESLEGGEVWIRNMRFARADSVKRFAVSVGNFKMPANAASLVEDLKTSGYEESKVGKSGDKYFVLIGSWARQIDALERLHEFEKKNPKWYYVGQPGALLVIGGSL